MNKANASKRISASLLEHDIKTVIRRYRRGDRLCDIARSLGYSSSNPVSDLLRSVGEIQPNVSRTTTKNILHDYSEYVSISQISRKYNVRIPEVKGVLYLAGLPLRDFGEQVRFSKSGAAPEVIIQSEAHFVTLVKVAIRQYEQGKSIRQLAFDYAVSVHTVKQTFLAAGVKLRDQLESKFCLRGRSVGQDLSNDVRALTGLIYKAFIDQINPALLVRSWTDHHLDHIYPVSHLGKSSLSRPATIWEVCHPANLRVIPAQENLRKSDTLEITVKQLRDSIVAWGNKYGVDPYYNCLPHSILQPFLDRYGTYNGYGNYGKIRCAFKRSYYQAGNWI